jgi:agmatine/peptidylarginine deiminase
MKNVFTLLVLLLTGVTQAQDLPNANTPEEKAQAGTYKIPFHEDEERAYTPYFSPPPFGVRSPAEWEEVQGYVVSWKSYSSMLREIVRYGKQECRMYIITEDANAVRTDLQNNGIDTVNVTFINAPSNSVWIRDYGPNCVYKNDVDSLQLIDWIYNRISRPKDDTVPEGMARHFQLPIYHATKAPYDFVATGGNWMTDGMGTAFSSKLIIDENKSSGGFGVNHTEAEIDTIVKKFLGVNRYIKMDKLPYDGIHHIDMHMKLLDEETLIVGEYPASISDGPQIEANLQYVLANFKTAFGTDYRVVRVPMPDDFGKWPSTNGDYLTYANASFVNKTILMPIYNETEDTTALRIWREACPGYRVVGINSNPSIPASGAIHCITHEISTANPLLMTHQRLRDTYNTTSPYTATATIKHRSGISSATLYYTTDTNQTYQSVSMTAGSNDLWSANIPAQAAGTEVFYYIKANASSGKEQVRPIVAPQGFYQFKVLGNSVGIREISLSEVVRSIFPNPSKGITCLPIETSQGLSLKIDCFNVLGEKVANVFEGETKVGENKFFLNTAEMPAGVYFIRYQTSQQETTKRLIVR